MHRIASKSSLPAHEEHELADALENIGPERVDLNAARRHTAASDPTSRCSVQVRPKSLPLQLFCLHFIFGSDIYIGSDAKLNGAGQYGRHQGARVSNKRFKIEITNEKGGL
jgi:hypothetical protein